jgi:hypothetical protein
MHAKVCTRCYNTQHLASVNESRNVRCRKLSGCARPIAGQMKARPIGRGGASAISIFSLARAKLPEEAAGK